jgi:predicted flap endonuclease-1-like 5' DNA nuclease
MIMQDILQILPLLLVASLIGAFITWLYWRSRWKMVSEERNWYSQKLTETENQYNGLLTQAGQLEISNQDLVKNLNASTAQNNNLATDLQAWQGRFGDLQKQSDDQRNRIAFLAPFETQTQTLTANLQAAEGKIGGLNADISALNTLKAKLEAQIADLNAQIGKLNTQNTQLSANLQAAEGKIGGLNADIDALNKLKAQLEAQIADLQNQKAALSASFAQVQGQYNSLLPQFEAAQNNALAQDGQLKAASAVEAGLTTQLSSWQNQYVEQTNNIASLKERIAELEALADKRADLNAILQTDLNALKLQLDAANEALDQWEAKYNTSLDLNVGAIHDLQTHTLNLSNTHNELSTNLSHMQEEYSTLEAMYEELQAEFDAQKSNVTQLQNDLADCQSNKTAPIVTTALTDTTNTETHPDWWRPTGAVVNPPAETTNSVIDFDRIGTASADEKDDLLIIKGIGPFIEGKLHALGIYTFRQIANFNTDDITKVNEAIEVFAGRIERERWVDQARDFANNRDLKSEEDRLLSKRRLINFDRIGTATEDQKDDLAAMKGIGPMIERQLNQIGIYTFQQLANLNADDIEIISDAVVLYPGRVAREQWVEQAKERLNG